jgi:tetratricopeptide (TPR) repeat protein
MQRTLVILGLAYSLWLLSACGGSKDLTQSPASTGPSDAQAEAANLQQAQARYIDATTLMIRGDFVAAEEAFEAVLETAPQLHAASYQLSKLVLADGRSEEALRYAQTAVAGDPDNYWYYLQLRRSREQRGEYGQAIDVQRDLVKRFPDRPEERVHLADLYLRTNRPKQAIEQLELLEQRIGVKEETARRRYEIYRNQAQHEAALGVARELVALRPDESYYYQLVADELAALGRKEERLQWLQELLERDPNDGFALLSLADYYKDSDDLARSDEYLFRAFSNSEIDPAGKLQIIETMLPYLDQEAGVRDRIYRMTEIFLATHPDQAGGYSARGQLFLAEGRLDSARFYLRKSLEREPADLAGWVDLIQLNYAQQQYAQMYEDAEEAMSYFPNQDRVLFFHGIASSFAGKNRRAISSLEKIIRVGSAPQELLAQAHAELGRIYHEQADYEASDRNLNAALEMTPKDPGLLNNYAYYLAVRGERLDQAGRMIEQALKAEPDQASYLDTYGWVLYQQGNYEKAERYIQKALDAGTASAEILEHHGDVLFKLGRREEAIAQWKRAQSAGGEIDVQKKLAQ